jgi:hypothetical protein
MIVFHIFYAFPYRKVLCLKLLQLFHLAIELFVLQLYFVIIDFFHIVLCYCSFAILRLIFYFDRFQSEILNL